jgi:hypothetical protein
VDIKEGDNTLDLTLYFDAQSDLPKAPPKGPDGGAPAGSAGPASSAKRPILK